MRNLNYVPRQYALAALQMKRFVEELINVHQICRNFDLNGDSRSITTENTAKGTRCPPYKLTATRNPSELRSL